MVVVGKKKVDADAMVVFRVEGIVGTLFSLKSLAITRRSPPS